MFINYWLFSTIYAGHANAVEGNTSAKVPTSKYKFGGTWKGSNSYYLEYTICKLMSLVLMH